MIKKKEKLSPGFQRMKSRNMNPINFPRTLCRKICYERFMMNGDTLQCAINTAIIATAGRKWKMFRANTDEIVAGRHYAI